MLTCKYQALPRYWDLNAGLVLLCFAFSINCRPISSLLGNLPSYLLILTSGKTHGTEDPLTFCLLNIHISLHSSALRSPIPSLQPQSYLDKWSPSSLLTPLLEFTSSTSTFYSRLFSTYVHLIIILIFTVYINLLNRQYL